MEGFLGIDIGTTNSKALLLTEDGDVIQIWKRATPRVKRTGREYFDILEIDRLTDSWIAEAKKLCELKSVGFSSIGESVIPVKNGRAMAMPLMWHEDTSRECGDIDDRFIAEHTGFEHTGVHRSGTFSLYKILWMERTVLAEKPDYWLPVSSYLIYRKTGTARWDTSQAGRSYFYDVHERNWIDEIKERFSLSVPEEIGHVGQACGEADGITYGLGGHDHYMGLYAVYTLSGGKELFYDSMGSSSVLAAIFEDKEGRLSGRKAYDPRGGCLVSGFSSDEYVVNRAMDYYGRTLDCIRQWSGPEMTADFFEEQNKKIYLSAKDRLCRLACQNDRGRLSDKVSGINFLGVKEDMKLPELILSTYIYLALGTGSMYENIARYCSRSPKSMPYFAGGGITENKMFMKLKATALDREIIILNTPELSALGAAVSGACSSGREAAVREAGGKLLYGEQAEPDEQYRKVLSEMRILYEQQ